MSYTTFGYTSKFDSHGDFLWVETWSGRAYELFIDDSDDLYVTGYIGVSGADAFLRKYDSDGNFQWEETWGGTGSSWCHGDAVTVDSTGNIYVSGAFYTTIEFNPDGGDSHTTDGPWTDFYLSKFNSSGEYQSVLTWGGDSTESVYGIDTDDSNNVFIAGCFSTTVDFDPGVGVHNEISHGSYDAFLLKLDSTGNFNWVGTWGGGSSDWSYAGVVVDDSGNSYTAGYFSGTVDFDPGMGSDPHSGSNNVFLTKFNSAGEHQWAQTWGSSGNDYGYGIGMHGNDEIFVAGGFYGTVDFDPGGETESRSSSGKMDAFVSKFDSAGNFQWVAAWGGLDGDGCQEVAADFDGYIYATGTYSTTADFDPGDGVDNQTVVGVWDVFLCRLLLDGLW